MQQRLGHLMAMMVLYLALGSAYLTDPPTKADSSTIKDCSNWYVATASGGSCAAIASQNGISAKDFRSTYVSRPRP
jgi:hypothetical protein